MRSLVAAVLLMVLLYLAVTGALPNEVVIMAAVLLVITWLLPATPKPSRQLPQTNNMPPIAEAAQDSQVSAQSASEDTDQEDGFFGRIYHTEDANELYVSLRQACNLASQEPSAFVGHLNRLLRDLPNRSLVMIGETSYPDFPKLLAGIPNDHIRQIEIAARTDMNPHVNATLECAIWLAGGVVRVRPQWCAKTQNRADEMVGTLLVPLVKHKALDKVSVLDAQGTPQRLPASYSGIVQCVFRLAGYPDAANSDEGENRLSLYTRQLVAAANQ